MLENVLQVSPIKKHNLRSKKSIDFKCNQIGKKAVAVALGEEQVDAATKTPSAEDSRILFYLKEKYQEVKESDLKIQILTIGAAADLSVDQLSKHFHCTKYLARVAIDVFKKDGILATPKYQYSHTSNSELDKNVLQFYSDSEISKLLPGRKDFVTVRDELGKKTQVQKRLLLFKLKTVHGKFLENHPEFKISFSKFARLRPPHIVFAGSSGTLTQCVCVLHANPDLQLEALQKLSTELNTQNCTDLIFSSMCSPASPNCNLGTCRNCPGLDKVIERLQHILDEQECEKVTFAQWITQERCRLEVLVKNTEEFMEMLEINLEKLKPHRFLVKVQHTFYNQLVSDLKPGEAIVLGDYAENYAFVLQDAVQSNHWTNSQATLHVFVVVYRETEGEELKYLNHVVISEYNIHGTRAVHLFQKLLFQHIRSKLKVKIKKVNYLTDGCGCQYKNKYNFLNLLYHKRDFKTDAKWDFHPTAHGKNLCDEVGGTVKRNAYRASHQRDAMNQIDSPKKLHEFIVQSMPKIVCDFTTEKQHNMTHNKILDRRFLDALPVTGCRSMHSFEPLNQKVIRAKAYSLSYDYKDFQLIE